ncbi:PHP domain-containing protein [Haloimpatiens massiliensis]|uniref:PHP domain-containing protein n=1 Tax=Haloimpatiens massiliensis TaxID=1658110 RepID=UPI000C85E5A9|nr:PHP domain-containing protein [Haloimpatiens massiliensis]
MIIDTHIHEKKYSPDSKFSLEEAVNVAKKIGLDGICITDHDNNKIKQEALDYGKKNDFLIIVGAEILTFEGDILVFGVGNLPEEMIHAEELLNIVKKHNGAAISAHPFRTNNRGLKDHIRVVKDLLSGVEVFNGSTTPHHNLYSYALATELNLPLFGASDAHVTENIGKYATVFNGTIRDEKDFIEAIKSKNTCPAILKNGKYEEINIYDTLVK